MVFLSASVPTPNREYFGTEDVFAIREAIIAFTKVCVEYNIHFYFGGHPAITPLVRNVAMKYTERSFPLIDIYQSKIFDDKIPKEVKDFTHIHFTEPVDGSILKSVVAMRKQMFEENHTDCAVFIGGMNGVLEEYHMLKEYYPNAEFLSFASTGGASADLYKEIGMDSPLLEGSYAYTSIFRELLKPFKNF